MLRRLLCTMTNRSASNPFIIWNGTTGGDRILPHEQAEAEEKELEEKQEDAKKQHEFDIENIKWMD